MSRALDKATKSWEVLEILEPVAGTNAIATQEIPSWVQFLKLTGTLNYTNPTTDEPVMRWSVDGSTFKAGASDYSYSYLFQSGNTVQAIAFTNTSLARFVLLGNTVHQPVFETMIDVGGVRGAQIKYPNWSSRCNGIPGGTTLGSILYTGYLNFNGPLRKINFMTGGTSTWLAGSRIILEGM